MKTLLCLLVGTGLLLGQFEYGEILGTVRDASQAVVMGAKVTLRNLDTNVVREGVTNEQGDYSFPGLRAGRYSIQSEKEGFRTATTSNLELRTGDHLRTDLALETGSVSEQITVDATAPLLETDTSERGQVVAGAQVRELPLNKRDYTQLVLLVPGTTYNADQRLGGAISVNGNRTLQNDYLLDGIDNNSHATSFRGDRVDVMLPSVDAVEEFRVQAMATRPSMATVPAPWSMSRSRAAVISCMALRGSSSETMTWMRMAGPPRWAGSNPRFDSTCTAQTSAGR